MRGTCSGEQSGHRPDISGGLLHLVAEQGTYYNLSRLYCKSAPDGRLIIDDSSIQSYASLRTFSSCSGSSPYHAVDPAGRRSSMPGWESIHETAVMKRGNPPRTLRWKPDPMTWPECKPAPPAGIETRLFGFILQTRTRTVVVQRWNTPVTTSFPQQRYLATQRHSAHNRFTRKMRLPDRIRRSFA